MEKNITEKDIQKLIKEYDEFIVKHLKIDL